MTILSMKKKIQSINTMTQIIRENIKTMKVLIIVTFATFVTFVLN